MSVLVAKKKLILLPRYRIIKRCFDMLIAVPSLVVLSPLIILTTLLVRLDSPGNPFFSQVRIGRNGKYFTMFKLRTLYLEHFGIFTDEEQPHAYRITRIGKYLRRSKIDEIPQLINVVLGHMSIVGPRPDVPVQLINYTTDQLDRFLVKPGLTGLSQVSGNTVLSWPNRIWLDIWYIKNWTLLMDIQIILFTVVAIIKGENLNADPFNLHRQLPFSVKVSIR